MQVLNQDETPLLYNLVFGEGIVNDVTLGVLFNAVQGFDRACNSLTISSINSLQAICWGVS